MGASLIRQFRGSLLQSAYQDFNDWLAARSMEDAFPLTEADVMLLQQYESAVGMARALIESKSPKWLQGWRDICRSTDERTVIPCALPFAGVGHNFPVMYTLHQATSDAMCLLANLSSFAMDFIARQKIGGTHLTYFILKQLPVCSPDIFRDAPPWLQNQCSLATWVTRRIIELVYVSWELSLLASSADYNGPPFRWDDNRRFLTRCEVDASFFHLYGIARDDIDYIMETFPIVKRTDEQQYGEYRTKRVILEIYDAMSEAIRTGQPYQSRLDPPPGPPINGLPDWPAGTPQPANWPSHIHPPRHAFG